MITDYGLRLVASFSLLLSAFPWLELYAPATATGTKHTGARCKVHRYTASSIALRPHTCALKLSADESDTEIAPGPAAGGGGEPAGEFEFAESRMSLLPSLLPLRPLLPPAEPFLPVPDPFRPAPDEPLRARKPLPLPA
jgi:hypothetical protein